MDYRLLAIIPYYSYHYANHEIGIISTNIRLLPYKTTVSFNITFTSQTDEVESETDHTDHEAKSAHFVVA